MFCDFDEKNLDLFDNIKFLKFIYLCKYFNHLKKYDKKKKHKKNNNLNTKINFNILIWRINTSEKDNCHYSCTTGISF